MAGIGQRFTSADHSSPWNTQSQCTMGRAVMHDCSKPVTTYGGNFNKRALFGNSSGSSGAPTFSDIATLCASGYSSRPGSSQHNGEILNSLTTAFPMRSYPNPADANTDSVSSFFSAVNYNGGQSGPPRNFSEPSLFPSLSSVNRTVGGDAPNNRVGGALGGASSMSSKPINDIMALSNNRTIGSIFSGSITCEAGNSSSTSVPPCSSRGVKLDPSEFPPILTSVGRTGNVSLAGGFHSSTSQPPLRNYVSVMSKGSPASDANTTQLGHQYAHTSVSQVTPPEFSKQDFPALPGTNQTGTTTTNPTSSTGTLTATSSVVHRSLSLNPASANSSGVGSTLSSHRSFTQTSGSLLSSPSAIGSTNFSGSTAHPNPSNGIQLLPNHLVTNIPKTMICDQFGMLGLLKLIRVGDYDATLNMLAPGLDLSSLHSNWQSPGELHNTFVSPCHDTCIGRPQDMDYPVPPEYLIRHLIADRLPDPPVDQLSEETLFWLFYNCCREEAQLVVAKELYQREWRFHKKEQIWLTRIMGGNFTTDNNSEHGDYYFWDPLKAQKSTHQMTILYSDLDNAPAAFRLSSGTLSAFVSIGMPGSGGANGHHSLNSQHSTSHSSLQQQQQQQLAMYQQQQQYSHAHQQSLLSNAQATSGSGSVCNALHQPSGQLLSHTNNSLAGGSTPSAATLAGLLTARQQQQQQQQQQKHQQISPSASYFQAPSTIHGRSVGGVPPLFGPRSGTTATGSGNVQQSTSPTSAGHLGNLINPAVASSVSSSQTTGSSGGGGTGTATGASKVSSEGNSDLDPNNLSRTQNQSSNANSDSSGPVHSSMFESSQQL
ncbi:unnamed protein product [Calicophoron daubneyi]|uniref:NOT2/NOT3/NOT5 C-terminal domain-containing protein n=1 Tax=Calicophoron daubneyi TaxID=300641 RepID=A0AAV2T252_CALDB